VERLVLASRIVKREHVHLALGQTQVQHRPRAAMSVGFYRLQRDPHDGRRRTPRASPHLPFRPRPHSLSS
jgi:hypothetical protein